MIEKRRPLDDDVILALLSATTPTEVRKAINTAYTASGQPDDDDSATTDLTPENDTATTAEVVS